MASASFSSSLATWNALERGVDRWASMGALTLAFLAVLVYVLI